MASVIHQRFSVVQYDRMIDAGIIAEDEPVELINGEIVRKMPIGKRHLATVNRLTQLLVNRLDSRAQVSTQNPVVFEDSEPEPDISVLAWRDDFYASGKPRAEDVALLIEVADASLEYDRDVKRPLYAQAHIADFWIVNLVSSVLEVHRDPQPDGSYASEQSLASGDLVRPLAFPDLELRVDEMLGI
ncbi:MAG: Uma2 family endonuclease [Planctomycetaceae bacterium]